MSGVDEVAIKIPHAKKISAVVVAITALASALGIVEHQKSTQVAPGAGQTRLERHAESQGHPVIVERVEGLSARVLDVESRQLRVEEKLDRIIEILLER